MSKALNQTFSNNAEQVQGSEVVDTQSNEYLEARQAFFDNMDKPQDIVENKQPTQESQSEPQTDDNQSIVKGEQDNGLQQEEVLNNQTQEIVEQTDESSEESEEETSDEPVKEQKTRQKRLYKVKADGQDFDFNIDELKLLASKGVNYTNKLQKLSPFRKMLSAIENAGITENEINQFIEMRKGNKDAIGAFTKKHNIALSDIEEGEKAEDYKPQEYGEEPNSFKSIDKRLSLSMDNRDYRKMCDFFNNELDSDSVKFFVDYPEALIELSKNIESGLFDIVNKIVQKGNYTDKYKEGVPYIQKYMYEFKQYEESQKQAKQPTLGNQQEQKQQVDKTKLGISGTKNIPDNTKKVISSIDEIDEEEYVTWKKKLMI